MKRANGSIIKRTLLSYLLISASVSAATINGVVHDQGGGAVSGANVSMYDSGVKAHQVSAVTGSDGKFSLNSETAGTYILKIEKPDTATIFRAFVLGADAKMEREFTMVAKGQKAISDRVISQSEEKTQWAHVGAAIATDPSHIARMTHPGYPPAAKAAHVQGTVNVGMRISTDGVPVELWVISSPSDDLSEWTLNTYREWRFRDFLIDGKPAAVETVLPYSYSLPN